MIDTRLDYALGVFARECEKVEAGFRKKADAAKSVEKVVILLNRLVVDMAGCILMDEDATKIGKVVSERATSLAKRAELVGLTKEEMIRIETRVFEGAKDVFELASGDDAEG